VSVSLCMCECVNSLHLNFHLLSPLFFTNVAGVQPSHQLSFSVRVLLRCSQLLSHRLISSSRNLHLIPTYVVAFLVNCIFTQSDCRLFSVVSPPVSLSMPIFSTHIHLYTVVQITTRVSNLFLFSCFFNVLALPVPLFLHPPTPAWQTYTLNVKHFPCSNFSRLFPAYPFQASRVN